MTVRFKIDDTEYEFDQNVLTVREARMIKEKTGLGLRTFGQGMQDGDPDALVCMLVIAKQRAGVVCKFSDFDDFNLNGLEMIDDDEANADDDGEAAEPAAASDPTPPASAPSASGSESTPS